jgi:hypothetical protein
VNPIRPAGYPAQPPAGPQTDAAKLAAQKAFFEAAMGRAAPAATARPTAAPAQVSAVAVAPQPVRAAPSAQAADSAPKVPRPGSLLDIRV